MKITTAEESLLRSVSEALSGRVDISRKIGAGGFGEVYGGTWKNTEVAVKVVGPCASSDRICWLRRAARLGNEIDLLARVRHSNIPPLYASGQHAGYLYAITPYRGHDFSKGIPGKLLSLHHILHVGVEIADTLIYLHDQGIIHRDVKPGNVMINAEGRVSLIDFGTARELEGPPENRLSGTPFFAAPEQCLGKREGTYTDSYSFGLMLYVLATNYAPYKVRNTDLYAMKCGPRISLSRFRPVQKDLATIVDASLDPEPSRRPSMRAIKEVLGMLQEDIKISAPVGI